MRTFLLTQYSTHSTPCESADLIRFSVSTFINFLRIFRQLWEYFFLLLKGKTVKIGIRILVRTYNSTHWSSMDWGRIKGVALQGKRTRLLVTNASKRDVKVNKLPTQARGRVLKDSSSFTRHETTSEMWLMWLAELCFGNAAKKIQTIIFQRAKVNTKYNLCACLAKIYYTVYAKDGLKVDEQISETLRRRPCVRVQTIYVLCIN